MHVSLALHVKYCLCMQNFLFLIHDFHKKISVLLAWNNILIDPLVKDHCNVKSYKWCFENSGIGFERYMWGLYANFWQISKYFSQILVWVIRNKIACLISIHKKTSQPIDKPLQAQFTGQELIGTHTRCKRISGASHRFRSLRGGYELWLIVLYTWDLIHQTARWDRWLRWIKKKRYVETLLGVMHFLRTQMKKWAGFCGGTFI